MGLTAGGAITAAMRFLVNVGSDAYLYDVQERARAEYLLREYGAEEWTRAPHWFRQGDDTIIANIGFSLVPPDFSAFGDNGQVYLNNNPVGDTENGAQTPLSYMDPETLLALVETAGASGLPTHYTVHGRVGGRPTLRLYPINEDYVTLSFRNYKKRVPDMVDYPLTAPVPAAGATGLLTGTYTYRVGFVVGDDVGETESGPVSDPVTVAAKKIELTAVQVSQNPAVTRRNIYRTEAGGTEQLFAGNIDDNVSTTYSDNVEDGDLDHTFITPLTASGTGMEQFPEDFHELILVRGLAAKLNPERKFDWAAHRKMAARIWSEQKQGQNVVTVMPAYGQMGGGGGYRSRLRGII